MSLARHLFSSSELWDLDSVDFGDTLDPDLFSIWVVTTLKGDISLAPVHALAFGAEDTASDSHSKSVNSWVDLNRHTDNGILVALADVSKNPVSIFLGSCI